MTGTVEAINFALALAGVALFLGTFVLAFDLYTNRTFALHVRRFGLMFAFFLVIAASAMTLVYSEIFGFVPCGLCWLQRVFLYPQVFIFGAGLYLRDKMSAYYALILSVPGFLVALYQHYIQMGGAEIIECPTAGGDCAQRILFEFGFMTFPLMSASLFLFVGVLSLYILKAE